MIRLTQRSLCSAAVNRSTSQMVFNSSVKRVQREVAIRRESAEDFEYLRNEVAGRVVDRLDDVKRDFAVIMDLGANAANLSPLLRSRRGVERLVHVDSSAVVLEEGKRRMKLREGERTSGAPRVEYVATDLEQELPFPDDTFDLVISSLSLHWINNLPFLLSQANRVLKPDGCFLAAMLGGETLQELRSAFAVVDMERLGGVIPHVSPFVRMKDAGDLLAASGLRMPTVDFDLITCRYPDMFTLMDHLQRMGEQGANLSRTGASNAPVVSRYQFLAAAAAYESMYKDEDGLLPATFQVIYMIAWKHHHSQPAPLDRGTAERHLKDLMSPESPSS